nr:NADH dehydrogenase subunit 4L [Didemnum perlucidum]
MMMYVVFLMLIIFICKKFELFKMVVFLEVFFFITLFVSITKNSYSNMYMFILFFFVGEGVFLYCMFIVNNFYMKKTDSF